MKQPLSAIVIGSGIAGMAIAIRLAVKGYAVTVIEKNTGPGGKLTAFEQDGFHFDAGPSLFTQPENVAALFELAHENMADYFSYQPVTIACKYFFENGKSVNAYTDARLFAKEMEDKLGEDAQHVLQYLERSEKLYNDIGKLFIGHSLHKMSTWLSTGIIKALAAVKPGYVFESLNHYNERCFSTVEATQLFNRFATYNGSNPFQTPAMLSLIPHLEQNQGTFYPGGGMISITNALYQLSIKKGVTYRFNSPVERILEDEGRATGVLVAGEFIPATIVVSNGDVYYTYKNLLGKEAAAQKVLKQERSSSAIIFYWGINRQLDQLGLHNIFFSRDYKKEFDLIFKKQEVTDDPTVYINITSKMEQSQAPAGKENWFVMVNAPADNGQDWQAMKRNLRTNVLNKLSRMLQLPIESMIASETTLDPRMIQEQTTSYKGSLYGTSSNSRLAAFLRHANFTGATKGLYFCGGSVHPGGGIPLCLKSAMIVSDIISTDAKHNF